LTTDLSRISGNFVIARNTALSLKGQSVDVRRLGTELGVRYVLEGSIRRAGDRVRLNPQLTDAETGAQLWADRFDTNCANVTENHDELTGRLARTLEVELMRAAAQRIDRDQAAEPNASDFVLRGRACRYRPSSPANRREALRNFERALELDAGSVEAKIGIASTLAADLADGWSRAPCRDMARAETLLLEALETGSNSAQAQLAIGLLRRLQKRFDEAGIALNAAIGFDRNNAGAFFQLGLTAMLTGRPEAAIPPIDRAIRLNPNDPVAANRYWGLGVCHLLLGQTDRALELMIRARAENPRLWYVHLDLAAALGLTGAVDAARAALAEAIELKPEVSSLRWLRAHPAGGNARYWALYEKSGAAGLRRVGTPET
jgi:tetratricopeptide (TPR) repeat protein